MGSLITYPFIAIASIGIIVSFWMLVAGKKLFASATNWFMLLQVMIMIGTTQVVDLDRGDDQRWMWVILGGMICFTLGAFVANLYKGFRPAAEIDDFRSAPFESDLHSTAMTRLVWGMAAVCAIAGLIFAITVGSNVFIDALMKFLQTGELVDAGAYGMARTTITTGREGYVAPGYTLQFTGVLLPLVLYLLYFRIRQRKRPVEVILALFLLAASLYFLTIFGGRGWIIHPMILFLLLISPMGPVSSMWRANRKTLLITIGGLAGFYMVSTGVMGRIDVTPNSLLDMSWSSLVDLYDRTMGDYAYWMLEVVHYLVKNPVSWGGEWWDSLVSILPGSNKGYGFSNELHQYLWGSREGNMGLNYWASLFYNWGDLGTLVIAFLTGFLMQTFTISYVRGPRSLSRLIILFVAGYRLAQFRDPYSLFLEGFFTTMVYYIPFWLLQVYRLRGQRVRRRVGPRVYQPLASGGAGTAATPTLQA